MPAGRSKRALSETMLDALARFPTGASRRRFLSDRRSLLHAGVARELQEAARSTMRVNSQRALAFVDAGMLIAHQIGNGELVAHGCRIKANILCALGKYKQALRLYHLSLTSLRKSEDREGIARTLSAAIQAMILAGQYERALAAASEARQLFEALGDARRLGMLENNVGNIYHRQDRFEEALVYYQRAYELLLPFRDSENLLISFNNLAMCLISLNDFSRAMATYQQARKTDGMNQMPVLRTVTDYNIAYLYFLRGQYREAIAMLEATRKVCKELGNPHLLALCDLDLSDIYLELNLSDEALETADEAFRQFVELELHYEAAKARTNQAIALGQLRQTSRSVEVFADARGRFLEEGNPVWPHVIDLFHATVVAQEGNHSEAQRLCLNAAEFFDHSGMPNKKILCHILLGRLALRRGDCGTARAESLHMLRAVRNRDSPWLQFQSHLFLGDLKQAQGKLRAAYQAYQRAFAEVELLRVGLDREELRLAFMSDKSAVYESLAKVCLANSADECAQRKAFAYAELAKSRTLVEGLHLREQQRESGTPGEGRANNSDLSEELSWFQRRIELEQLQPSEKSRERIVALDREVEVRRAALRRSMRRATVKSPSVSVLRIGDSLSLDEICASLPQNATLIEYFSIEDEFLVAVIERNALEVRVLTTNSRIKKELRALRFQLEKPGWYSQAGRRLAKFDLEATNSHLAVLYGELIAPIRSLITGSHLIIVPHGVLHSIPFHALFDGQHHLIDWFTISYAPSASAFVFCQEKGVHGWSNDLVVGVPDARAPDIAQEVETVHGLLTGSALLVGKEATLGALQEAGRRSRYIHIATHGIFRPDNPMYSGIWLGDSFLHLYQFLELDLPADLLVLSGCGTGMSAVTGGDEQLGFVRGVLLAGARSALLTLWNVHDRSTSEFMQGFYRRLAISGDKADSLRETLLDLRDNRGHPYYWAPFCLIGALS